MGNQTLSPEQSTAVSRAALEMVLLFHSASPWTHEKRVRWVDLMHQIEITTGAHLTSDSTEATTRVLCECVRRALL